MWMLVVIAVCIGLGVSLLPKPYQQVRDHRKIQAVGPGWKKKRRIHVRKYKRKRG